MSEYQYDEFQAIDRPLSEADRRALRDISTRARITSTSFTNTYEWGDLKADPARLVERYFDLFLYVANWGSHRFALRLPKRLVDKGTLDAFLGEVDCADVRVTDAHVILDIGRQEVSSDDRDDGSGWMAALTPLRADILAGDLRMVYLLWLTAVQEDVFEDDEPEPLPGIGPLTAPLEAFAEFFGIDPDLVHAAAERAAAALPGDAPSAAVRKVIVGLTEAERTNWLCRLFDGDVHVGAELRARLRADLARGAAAPKLIARTVGELRARATAIRQARLAAAAAKQAAARKLAEKAAKAARQAKLTAMARRGEGAWRDVDTEIDRRSATGYDNAAELLRDLRDVAAAHGTLAAFQTRLDGLRVRHAAKGKFLERIREL
jgi:hypothetical protein